MGQRKKKQGVADTLAMFPWWISFALGGVGFAVLRWVLPTRFAANPMLGDLASLSRSLAWAPLLLFVAMGLVALMRSRSLRQAIRNTRTRRVRLARNTLANMSRMRFKHGWGVTRMGGNSLLKPKAAASYDSWSLGALRALEWRHFEMLCVRYFELSGFKSQTLRRNPDGSVDIKLSKLEPQAIVHFKSWNIYTVGAKEVRELLGAMGQEKINRGIFITTGTFNREALNFVEDHQIQLLDGEGFLRKIQALPEDQQNSLFKLVFEGDYRTPTCPSCGLKMTTRKGEHGAFWGCVNFPKCNRTLPVKP